jgi:hypothetical protein
VWMLEYATAIRSHRDDPPFWQETVAAIQTAPETRIGIGVASLIVSNAFGVAPPALFLACTVDKLPGRVRLWAGRYEDELVYVECPGSKLYLLLEDVLLEGQPNWPSQRHRKLLPSHLPPRSVAATGGGDIRLPSKTAAERVRFAWTRLRFHVTAGLRYKIEAVRWKKFIADFQA